MSSNAPTVVANHSRLRNWLFWLLLLVLAASLFANYWLWSTWNNYFSGKTPVQERFHSGDESAKAKIALLRMSGTIMPPFTERLLDAIDSAAEDDAVRGVILEVDSPGGFIADSHQIYHRLQLLAQKKPIYVRMKRIAASGGLYIAMGAGPDAKIFVEPTTWTGSIGVIIPRYDMAELAKKTGISADPLKTGLLKDSLNPFREMTAEERQVWDVILDDAFQQFLSVIEKNRTRLDRAAVEKLATGQIYTARQALDAGLVDETGFLEDVVESLKQKIGINSARVVVYETMPGLFDVLNSYTIAQSSANPARLVLDMSVPRAMYFCSWAPVVPGVN